MAQMLLTHLFVPPVVPSHIFSRAPGFSYHIYLRVNVLPFIYGMLARCRMVPFSSVVGSSGYNSSQAQTIELLFWKNFCNNISDSISSCKTSNVTLYHDVVIKLFMGSKSILLKEGALS